MVINISLDLLIGTCISANKFIMKRIVWSFFDKKSFANSNGLLKLKNIDVSFEVEISQMKKKILIHIPNLLLGFNI
jgi:hypothetical protein